MKIELSENEIYIEKVRVFKDNKYFCMSIGKVINKKNQNQMVIALKSQLNADKVYMITTEL